MLTNADSIYGFQMFVACLCNCFKAATPIGTFFIDPFLIYSSIVANKWQIYPARWLGINCLLITAKTNQMQNNHCLLSHESLKRGEE